jgi:hypothetical protein
MENNYVQLEEGHKRLVEENLKLRELVASLGGDLSAIAPIPPLEEINSEDLEISSKNAKRTKLDYRDTTVNSFESAAGAFQPAGRGDHCTTFGFADHEFIKSDEPRILPGVQGDALDELAVGRFDWLQECTPTTPTIKALSVSSAYTTSSDVSRQVVGPDEMELETELLDLAEFIFD